LLLTQPKKGRKHPPRSRAGESEKKEVESLCKKKKERLAQYSLPALKATKRKGRKRSMTSGKKGDGRVKLSLRKLQESDFKTRK